MKNSEQGGLLLLFHMSKPQDECTGQAASLNQFQKASIYILSIEVSKQTHSLGRQFQNYNQLCVP